MDGLPLLRLAEARLFWQEPQTIFLDVRTTDDYAVGHIPGAIHFPEEEFQSASRAEISPGTSPGYRGVLQVEGLRQEPVDGIAPAARRFVADVDLSGGLE